VNGKGDTSSAAIGILPALSQGPSQVVSPNAFQPSVPPPPANWEAGQNTTPSPSPPHLFLLGFTLHNHPYWSSLHRCHWFFASRFYSLSPISLVLASPDIQNTPPNDINTSIIFPPGSLQIHREVSVESTQRVELELERRAQRDCVLLRLNDGGRSSRMLLGEITSKLELGGRCRCWRGKTESERKRLKRMLGMKNFVAYRSPGPCVPSNIAPKLGQKTPSHFQVVVA
jgi:hypothetical protein